MSKVETKKRERVNAKFLIAGEYNITQNDGSVVRRPLDVGDVISVRAEYADYMSKKGYLKVVNEKVSRKASKHRERPVDKPVAENENEDVDNAE